MSGPSDMVFLTAHRSVMALMTLALTLCLAAPTTAQTTEDLRPTFMQGCLEDGTSEGDCVCIFEGWTDRIDPDQLDTARIAISMYSGEKPSSEDDMMAATQMMQGLASVSLECALGGAALLEGIASPGPGEPAADSAVDENSGDEDAPETSDILKQLMALDTQQKARDAARDAEEKRTREAEDRRITERTRELRAAYAAELDRIHSRPIDDWAVADFGRLFGLYCQAGGGRAESCACAWPILADLSTFNAIPYLASRSEGDDARQRLSAADFSAAFFTLREFNDRRQVCDASE